jgi:hypothetical protein
LVRTLLRQRLDERSKTQKRSHSGAEVSRGGTARSSLTTVQALDAAGTATKRQLRRAVIQGLLADQFGEALVNDAKFQPSLSKWPMRSEPMKRPPHCFRG